MREGRQNCSGGHGKSARFVDRSHLDGRLVRGRWAGHRASARPNTTRDHFSGFVRPRPGRGPQAVDALDTALLGAASKASPSEGSAAAAVEVTQARGSRRKVLSTQRGTAPTRGCVPIRRTSSTCPYRTASWKTVRGRHFGDDHGGIAVREGVEGRVHAALDGVSIGTTARSASPRRTAASASEAARHRLGGRHPAGTTWWTALFGKVPRVEERDAELSPRRGAEYSSSRVRVSRLLRRGERTQSQLGGALALRLTGSSGSSAPSWVERIPSRRPDCRRRG